MKYLTLQNIVITVLVIFFMMIGGIATGMFQCTNNAVNQEGPYKFVSKNGEGVIFIPQLKSKVDDSEVIASLAHAGGYEKVDVLPVSASADIVCTITPIQKAFNLYVECADPEHRFPVHKIYDATLRSSMGPVGFVDYGALPEFIDDLREDVRNVI